MNLIVEALIFPFKIISHILRKYAKKIVIIITCGLFSIMPFFAIIELIQSSLGSIIAVFWLIYSAIVSSYYLVETEGS